VRHRRLTRISSAGIVGPVSTFLNDPTAPENTNAETLGNALFNDDGPEAWTEVYKIDTFSIYYMTTAFLGLLDKGSRDIEGYTSSVVNITSISGIVKIAQRHVSASLCLRPYFSIHQRKVRI
jgi:NAD(P)-dependent dehydrogenase (short-subunit alcohol dehydrogenase family)